MATRSSLTYDVSGSTAGVRSGTSGYGGFGVGSGGGFSMSGIGIGIGFPIGGSGGDTALYQRSLTVQIDRLGARADELAQPPAASGASAPGSPRIF